MTNDARLLAAPDAAAIRAALLRLPRPVPDRKAALHLALPVSCAVGMQVTLSAGVWSYRDVAVTATADPAADAARLAAAGHRDGDVYLDLDADPEMWLKLIRSGCRRYVFGLTECFGLPRIGVEDGVSDDAALAVADDLITAGRIEVPGVRIADGAPVIVDGRPGAVGPADAVVLRPVQAQAAVQVQPASAAPIAEVAAEVASKLGADGLEVAELPARVPGVTEADVLCALGGGWTAVVPVVVGPGSEIIGVDHRDVIGADGPLTVPEGFTAVGMSTWEDAVIATHDDSGIRVLLGRD